MRTKLLIITLISIKLLLLLKYNPPLSADQGQLYYFAHSLPHVNSETRNQLITFGQNQGYFLFWVPTVLLTIVPLPAIKLVSLTFLILSAFLFSKIIGKNKILSFSLFLFSPWQNYLTIYHFPATFTTFLALITIYTRSPLPLTLTAFTSWPGLIFSFIISAALFTKSKTKSLTLITIITLTLFINQSFVKNTTKTSFLNQLTPSKLAFEINERQKIMFLATNKTYILPPLVRKISLNKPALLSEKLLKHAVSIFDFEQTTFPLSSYEITRLSGILPKGNSPLLYPWELPLLLLGIFLITRSKTKQSKLYLLLTLAAFTPYMFFEKKFLTSTAFLLSPLILAAEVVAIKRLQKKHSPLLLIISPLILASFIKYHQTFFLKQLDYRTAHSYYYQEISQWLKQNSQKYEKNIVTTRFGPTPLMTALYLQSDPNSFWPQYLKDEPIKLSNIIFSPFDLSQDLPEKNIPHIGLIGEFVGPGKDIENKDLPPNFVKLKEINGQQALVFEYGDKLWIGYTK